MINEFRANNLHFSFQKHTDRSTWFPVRQSNGFQFFEVMFWEITLMWFHCVDKVYGAAVGKLPISFLSHNFNDCRDGKAVIVEVWSKVIRDGTRNVCVCQSFRWTWLELSCGWNSATNTYRYTMIVLMQSTWHLIHHFDLTNLIVLLFREENPPIYVRNQQESVKKGIYIKI